MVVLTEREVTAVAYEMMQESDGVLLVLVPLNQIADRRAFCLFKVLYPLAFTKTFRIGYNPLQDSET